MIFTGVVHPRLVRQGTNNACSAYGTGTNQTTLVLNTLAETNDSDYCAVMYSEVSY